MFKLIPIFLILSIVCTKLVAAFTAEFRYFGKLHLKADYWNLNVTLPNSDIVASLNSSTGLCKTLPDAYNNLETIIKGLQLENGDEKYVTISRKNSYKIAQENCRKMGPTCDLATVNSRAELDKIKKSVKDTNLDTIFLGYHTENNYFISKTRSIRQKVDTKHFLSGKTIVVDFCPRPFLMWPGADFTSCFLPVQNATSESEFTYEEAKDFCKSVHNGKLWEPEWVEMDMKVNSFYGKHFKSNKYFIQGLYFGAETIADIKPCTKGTNPGTGLRALYNFEERCLEYVPSENAKGGALCYKNGKFQTTVNSKDFWSHTKNSFDNKPAGLHFNIKHNTFILQDMKFPHPSLCHCTENEFTDIIEETLKLSVLEQFSSDKKHIEKRCNDTIYSADHSKFIVNLSEASEKKRHKRSPIFGPPLAMGLLPMAKITQSIPLIENMFNKPPMRKSINFKPKYDETPKTDIFDYLFPFLKKRSIENENHSNLTIADHNSTEHVRVKRQFGLLKYIPQIARGAATATTHTSRVVNAAVRVAANTGRVIGKAGTKITSSKAWPYIRKAAQWGGAGFTIGSGSYILAKELGRPTTEQVVEEVLKISPELYFDRQSEYNSFGETFDLVQDVRLELQAVKEYYPQYNQDDIHIVENSKSRRRKRSILLNSHLKSYNEAFRVNAHLSSVSNQMSRLRINFDTALDDYEQLQHLHENFESQVMTDSFYEEYVFEMVRDAQSKLPHGYSFLTEDIQNLMQFAGVDVYKNSLGVTAVYALPIVKTHDSLEVYRSIPLPYMTGNGIPVLPVFEAPFLGVTHDFEKYALLTSADIVQCLHNEILICPTVNLFQATRPSCTYAHFMGNAKSTESCKYNALKTSVFRYTDENKLFYSVPKPMPVTTFCTTPGKFGLTRSVSTISGTGNITVNASCSISVDNKFFGINSAVNITAELLPKAEAQVSYGTLNVSMNKILNFVEPIKNLDPVKPLSDMIQKAKYKIVVATVAITVGMIALIILCCKCQWKRSFNCLYLLCCNRRSRYSETGSYNVSSLNDGQLAVSLTNNLGQCEVEVHENTTDTSSFEGTPRKRLRLFIPERPRSTGPALPSTTSTSGFSGPSLLTNRFFSQSVSVLGLNPAARNLVSKPGAPPGEAKMASTPVGLEEQNGDPLSTPDTEITQSSVPLSCDTCNATYEAGGTVLDPLPCTRSCNQCKLRAAYSSNESSDPLEILFRMDSAPSSDGREPHLSTLVDYPLEKPFQKQKPYLPPKPTPI